LLIAALGSFVFFRFTLSAKGLEQYVIDPTDLSQGAKILYEGEEVIEDTSHPLGLGATSDGVLLSPSSEEEQPLYEYVSAYGFSAVLPDENVVIADFVYQYSTQLQARTAAKIFSEDLLAEGAQSYALPAISKEIKDFHGQGFTLKGLEGDYVTWFVGARDNVLVLVLTNGMNDNTVNTAFDSAIEDMYQQ